MAEDEKPKAPDETDAKPVSATLVKYPNLKPNPWTSATAPRGAGRPKSFLWSTRRMRKAWYDPELPDESRERKSLLTTLLDLADGKNCDPKTQLEAIKFAWKIAHGEFKKQLDDTAAQKIAEQLFAQAIAQAEERRRIAEANATEIETKGADDGEKGE